MILTSEDKQFRLLEDGQIAWQKDPTNPMPGQRVAQIIRGESILFPGVTLPDGPLTEGQDRDILTAHIKGWLERHIRTVLEPLFRTEENETGPAADIYGKLCNALGILPREELEDMLTALDPDGKAALRRKKIRSGPLLVFLPELNKPAAVRLRAVLWALWNGKDLPPEMPADGIVSFNVTEKKDCDPAYYRAIGYPVYGPRALRADMLDRVVCAVYDNASGGTFEARHNMAEWLGCNIADLYAILEAMGHSKIHDPLEEKIKAEEAAAPQTETSVSDKPQEKPALATFRLKRGKAAGNAARQEKPQKPEKKPPRKQKRPEKKKQDKSHKERVFTADAQQADSPFAVLQQLKDGNAKK